MILRSPYKEIEQAKNLLELGYSDEALVVLKTVRRPGTTRDHKTFVSYKVRKYVKDLERFGD